ncbi:MAG: FAD-dependent oxidoreductase [Dehalococcoidia bacterium]|nr:FAD-dependent oxidoreductase [Dehalococcoidia bacterium]
MSEAFEVVVVGAGPAGCAAAYTLAKAGIEVLLIERSKFAGGKNVTGGVLYGSVLNVLIPEFWKEAPVERRVQRHVISMLSEKSSVSIDFNTDNSAHPETAGYTILRAKFDRWFAQKVEEAGGMVITGSRADDLILEDDRVAGIVAGGDKIAAKVVIAADGVNSLLADKAGLGVSLEPGNVNQGVKEVIKLPRETIEERFNVTSEGGAAMHFLGFCTRGVHGGGFLYTNQDSLSVGVVVQLKALVNSKLKAVELLDSFKQHPAVRELVKGGTPVEYSAHLVPAGGLRMLPQLYTDGMLVTGDAAALVLATGRALEGLNFALASGVAAAETVKMAKEKGDYSQQTLSHYVKLLSESFVLQDLVRFYGAPQFLENPRLYGIYPELACALAEKVFEVDGNPKRTVWQLARDEMRGKVSFWQLIRDAMAARRTL